MKNIEEILKSVENTEVQSPSYFFKEQVLKKYYASKKAVQKEVEDWLPWFQTNWQVTFVIFIFISNLLIQINMNEKKKYHEDLKSLKESLVIE